MGISNRLREVMEYKGVNIKTLAELLNMPYRTLQNYLLNERTPSAEVLIKVRDIMNIDLNWLMCGEGNMFRSSTSESKLNEKEKQLIKCYRKMPRDMQVAFEISFNFLSEK
ncbi:helix-turn-helix domain-containing protein [Haemophilus sp. oral taxon 851]|uniref:helix-turn-helix domain-containing protein n=1 Tax=Haemophilus sp. oral taxon 851 TaxID=762964 RepID=UPI0002462512|nr:helix-turn-helix transcriptional regulator [Haemophilus sp. oral taxon 851]EHO46626.1 DNA-binding helix-turn-helix protein [Haemophilus sp. oral taxon 851 str. F0397]